MSQVSIKITTGDPYWQDGHHWINVYTLGWNHGEPCVYPLGEACLDPDED